MACACSIVVVGSAGVASVRSCVAVVEFAEAANTVKSGEIPLTRKEHRFPSYAHFELGQEVMVIEPVSRFFQGLGALHRINSRADRDRVGQRCF